MSGMSRVYGEIEDMYHRGFAEAVIAMSLDIPIEFVQDVIDSFGAEWDAERYGEEFDGEMA